MDFDYTSLEAALVMLGQRIQRAKQHYEVVAVGGGSLMLLGYIDRTTKDLDLVAVVEGGHLESAGSLPKGLVDEIKNVGTALEIGESWINSGPTALLEAGLPSGFEGRWVTRIYGGLTVHLAGRLDQICFKLYAAVDQGPTSKHFADLLRLEPVRDELLVARTWCLTQDESQAFSMHLDEALLALGVTFEDDR